MPPPPPQKKNGFREFIVAIFRNIIKTSDIYDIYVQLPSEGRS